MRITAAVAALVVATGGHASAQSVALSKARECFDQTLIRYAEVVTEPAEAVISGALQACGTMIDKASIEIAPVSSANDIAFSAAVKAEIVERFKSTAMAKVFEVRARARR